MAGAFGFSQPNQQPTPDPRAVGQQLMQPRQQQPQPQTPLASVDPDEAAQTAAVARNKMLRREGGKLMGGGGDDSNPALSQAVGELLTSIGGGHRGNPNPHKNREGNLRQLRQLHLSDFEAELLREVV